MTEKLCALRYTWSAFTSSPVMPSFSVRIVDDGADITEGGVEGSVVSKGKGVVGGVVTGATVA